MPTGYTSAVADGKINTLEGYAFSCARGMMALISMRDDPYDAPIPDQLVPSTSYHTEALAEARALMAELVLLTPQQCEERARQDYEAAVASLFEYRQEKALTKDRYLSMIAKVQTWEGAPEGLKEFALSQLEQSLDFDCKEYPRPAPELLTVDDWRQTTLDRAAKNIGYHEAEVAKEIARTAMRNEWLRQLRASLNKE